MRFIKIMMIVICTQILVVSGCGGGGGSGSNSGGSTTKLAKMVFTSNSANPSDKFGGFDLTVTLPVGVTIVKDSSGTPLSSAVYLSGKMINSTLSTNNINYNLTVTPNVLKISFPGTVDYDLGEFLTVVCDVPVSYIPNINSVVFSSTYYLQGNTGVELPLITTTATFI